MAGQQRARGNQSVLGRSREGRGGASAMAMLTSLAVAVERMEMVA
jgi:hypothetical protein